MNHLSFEEELTQTGHLICPNVGNSMLPLIRQGKDLMVIVPKPQRRLRPLEAIFYRRGEKYLLHRVFWRRKNDYLIGADNRIFAEKGITDDAIIGVLHAILRNGKTELPVHSFPYQAYLFLWYLIYPFRVIIMMTKQIQKGYCRKT